jgi:uncharacterized protein (DUF1697 family)
MSRYLALLRAVNVGGTGKLPMKDLRDMCVELGYTNVRTYIASGNVIFDTNVSEANIKTQLEQRLQNYAGKPVGVLIRNGAEMRSVLDSNPFPEAPGNRNLVIFLDTVPPADTITKITGQDDEKIVVGAREIYVHYGESMGPSKLKIPAAKHGTARNMNTVAKLVEMLGG